MGDSTEQPSRSNRRHGFAHTNHPSCRDRGIDGPAKSLKPQTWSRPHQPPKTAGQGNRRTNQVAQNRKNESAKTKHPRRRERGMDGAPKVPKTENTNTPKPNTKAAATGASKEHPKSSKRNTPSRPHQPPKSPRWGIRRSNQVAQTADMDSPTPTTQVAATGASTDQPSRSNRRHGVAHTNHPRPPGRGIDGPTKLLKTAKMNPPKPNTQGAANGEWTEHPKCPKRKTQIRQNQTPKPPRPGHRRSTPSRQNGIHRVAHTNHPSRRDGGFDGATKSLKPQTWIRPHQPPKSPRPGHRRTNQVAQTADMESPTP